MDQSLKVVLNEVIITSPLLTTIELV